MSTTTLIPDGLIEGYPFIAGAQQERLLIAFNSYIAMVDPKYAIESISCLMRGWIASDRMVELNAEQRADIFFHYEQLQILLQELLAVIDLRDQLAREKHTLSKNPGDNTIQ